MRDYPAGVRRIYDNGGRSVDRYTVYYTEFRYVGRRPLKMFECVGMNAYPFSPAGFGQHSEGTLGRHNGKAIKFRDLPKDCQKLVLQDLGMTF